MAQKVLSEEQMREYVEREVRKALMEESEGNAILTESINEVLDESMTDENVFSWLNNLLGRGGQQQQGQAGGGVTMEGIIGAILGRFFAPVLKKLLAKIGIEPNGPIGSVIVNAASTIGGYGIGQLVDKKWDPFGIDNIFRGSAAGKTLPRSTQGANE